VTAPGVPASLGLRGGVRLVALAVWLLVCIAGYYAWPSSRWRKQWPPRLFRGSLRIIGVRLSQSGTQAGAPRLLLANHLSWLDILVLGGVTGTVFVARDSLAAQPVLRWLCSLNSTVFIAREDRLQVGGQIEQMRAALTANPAVALFPEGGTGDGRTLGPFRSSLLAAVEPPPAGLTIQPVWIDYGADAAEIAWFGTEDGLANFKRIIARKRPLSAWVHLLAPLRAAECGSRKTMAAAARRRIAEAMEA
jgi:1-acyl-sn-glycerol-3-phosphate acyltransferase